MEDLRVIVVTDDSGRTPVSSVIKESIEDAANHLRSRGADVRHARFPRLRRAIEHWAVRMHQGSSISFTERLEDGKPIRIGRELLSALRGTSAFTLPALGLAMIEKTIPFRESGMESVLQNAAELRREIEEAMGPHGVMLYPTYPSVAPRHGEPLLWPVRFVYTAAINTLELPSTQVPMGLDHQGLPKGFQVITTPHNDFRSIAVAIELERAFGGWVPPPRPSR